MSQENVEVVRAWVDRWVGWFNSDRDPDRLATAASEYLTPTVTYEEDPVWPDAGAYRGVEAVLRRFSDYIEIGGGGRRGGPGRCPGADRDAGR